MMVVSDVACTRSNLVLRRGSTFSANYMAAYPYKSRQVSKGNIMGQL